MKISVSCAAGCELAVKRELRFLGYGDLPAIGGRISFEGAEEDVCKCNLLLRAANRVYIELACFKAETFDELFDGIKQIEWEKYISEDGKIDVSAKCVESKLHAVSVTQSITKKAICERLSRIYKSELAENGERYKIEISVLRDMVTASLDTSGAGLHRRGYRALVGEAPLKETLASAIIELSVWNPSRPFADPFCGSGTIAIEACRYALGIPSGGNRDFDFLHWRKFDSGAFEPLKKQAFSAVKDLKLRVSAFDIDEKQLKLAGKHAELAGVADFIHFQKADMRDFSSSYPYGVIITNPPYGERLSDVKEVEKLLKDYGKMVRSLPEWSAYTITPAKNFEKLFGKKADKKRKIYNGSIECCVYAELGNPPPKKEKGESANF